VSALVPVVVITAMAFAGLSALPGAAAAAAPAAPVGSSPPRPQGTITVSAFAIGGKISCGSPTSCLAVGVSFNNPDNPRPIAEAWNGTGWRSVAVPTPKPTVADVFLAGVSCRSATSCLVVGTYLAVAGTGSERPYALTWNGKSLAPTSRPSAPKGSTFGSLTGVSCVTARSCVAVGDSSGGGGPVLMETWNGTKWTLRTARIPGGGFSAYPSAISCRSATSCVAVGATYSTSGAQRMFLDRWNGKSFTAMKAAAPAGATNIYLNDVSCASPNSCAAAGMSTNAAGTSGFGFIEVWNGRSWAPHKVAVPKGDTESFLFGVSCATARSCIAVGAAGSSKGGAASALSYNGKTWSSLNVPAPGKGKSSDFEGVSCLKADDCVAIGEIGAAGKTTTTPLAGRWNGSSWKLVAA
jgi:hypothetical protein